MKRGGVNKTDVTLLVLPNELVGLKAVWKVALEATDEGVWLVLLSYCVPAFRWVLLCAWQRRCGIVGDLRCLAHPLCVQLWPSRPSVS